MIRDDTYKLICMYVSMYVYLRNLVTVIFVGNTIIRLNLTKDIYISHHANTPKKCVNHTIL